MEHYSQQRMPTNNLLRSYRQLIAPLRPHCPGSVRAVALGLMGVIAPLAHAQNALGLSPMLQSIDMSPGQTRNGSLTLGNDDKQPSRFRTEILDFSVDQEATSQYERDIPGEAPFSCKLWLTAN